MFESGDNEREQRQQSETGEILRWFLFLPLHKLSNVLFNIKEQHSKLAIKACSPVRNYPKLTYKSIVTTVRV
jgi:hypothetical protein